MGTSGENPDRNINLEFCEMLERNNKSAVRIIFKTNLKN